MDLEVGTARAKAALLLTLALPGSVYLYQGEELGLAEVQELPDGARRDPIWERSGHTEHGRDGSRVPLPWTEAGDSFGFSPEGGRPPWLPQPEWFGEFAVSAQECRPDSVLSFYRAALTARRLIDETAPFEWLDAGHAEALAFRRGNLTSLTVFGGEPVAPPAAWGPPELRSDLAEPGIPIPPNATAWFRAANIAVTTTGCSINS